MANNEQPVREDAEPTDFKTFTVYRTGDLSETHDENQAPPSPDEPAYWGVVFPDGTCVLRWAGVVRAHSVWASFDDAMKVHGHPEPRYGTRIEWSAPQPDFKDLARRLAEGAIKDFVALSGHERKCGVCGNMTLRHRHLSHRADCPVAEAQRLFAEPTEGSITSNEPHRQHGNLTGKPTEGA